jgi:hypothetical protein
LGWKNVKFVLYDVGLAFFAMNDEMMMMCGERDVRWTVGTRRYR